MKNIPIFSLCVLILAIAGCTQSGPPVHPVKGQVQLAGGDNRPLAGHIVEVALASDPLVRASGEIKPDGQFQLEALLEGQLRKGAPEGKYLARIVLADDDPQLRRAAAAAIDPRHLKFDTSG